MRASRKSGEREYSQKREREYPPEDIYTSPHSDRANPVQTSEQLENWPFGVLVRVEILLAAESLLFFLSSLTP